MSGAGNEPSNVVHRQQNSGGIRDENPPASRIAHRDEALRQLRKDPAPLRGWGRYRGSVAAPQGIVRRLRRWHTTAVGPRTPQRPGRWGRWRRLRANPVSVHGRTVDGHEKRGTADR